MTLKNVATQKVIEFRLGISDLENVRVYRKITKLILFIKIWSTIKSC